MSRRAQDLAAYVEHFRARVLQDAINEALPTYWERRERDFEFVGNARCDEVATACRNKAEVLRRYPLVGIEPDVEDALREAS